MTTWRDSGSATRLEQGSSTDAGFNREDKTPLERPSCTLLEKPASGTSNKPLCHQVPGNRVLNSYDTPKDGIKPDYTCMSSGDLKTHTCQTWLQTPNCTMLLS
ncbi:hypothetical protein E5288_WYG009958 [Bos mutus]|uniref:Uncharacterized protein n=1 Tax=Bos mutus TaxID=72004 RepID=A0A6B0S9J9_9CETA|nr:hypothetical protein [Bos mutus]